MQSVIIVSVTNGYLLKPAKSLIHCIACGSPLGGHNRGDFIVPQFGFISDSAPPEKPGEARPERTYTTRTYFRGVSKEIEALTIPLRDINVVVVPARDGELAIINHAGYQGFKVCHTLWICRSGK